MNYENIMSYHEKKEPIRFNLLSEIYDEYKKEMVPFSKMVVNRTRLGIEWPEKYTLLVFEKDSYPEATYVKLIKMLDDLSSPETFVKHVTCATIERGDTDLSTMVTVCGDEFVRYLMTSLKDKKRPIVDIIYYRSKSERGKPQQLEHIVDNLSNVYLKKSGTWKQIEFNPIIHYQEAFAPILLVEYISKFTEL